MKFAMISFKQYHENCNVCAGELIPGDHVENINPECDHFRSKGIVIKIKKIPQDEEKTAGRVVIYKVSNNSSDFPEDEVNGIFNRGDKLAKTEIQLKKLLKQLTEQEYVPKRSSVYVNPASDIDPEETATARKADMQVAADRKIAAQLADIEKRHGIAIRKDLPSLPPPVKGEPTSKQGSVDWSRAEKSAERHERDTMLQGMVDNVLSGKTHREHPLLRAPEEKLLGDWLPKEKPIGFRGPFRHEDGTFVPAAELYRDIGWVSIQDRDDPRNKLQTVSTDGIKKIK